MDSRKGIRISKRGLGSQTRVPRSKKGFRPYASKTVKASATKASIGDASTDRIKMEKTAGILSQVIGEELTKHIYEKFDIDPRHYLEMSGPTTQCEQGGAGKVVYYKPGAKGDYAGSLKKCTKCYMCGLPILVKKDTGMAPECEHVLPVVAAAIYLKLYSGADKGKVTYQIQLVYEWAHEVCNQVKSDVWPLFIKRQNGGSHSSQKGGVKESAGPGVTKSGRIVKPKSVRMRSANVTVRLPKTKGNKKSVTKRTLLAKAPPQVEYKDGDYDLQAILTGDQPPIVPPKAGSKGELMTVNQDDIDELLGNIWETTRVHSSYIKRQFVKVFGTKEKFIACRRNHLINIYQEIADHINNVKIGGHSLANLMTLAGLAGLEPKMYRPDIFKQINPEELREETSAALEWAAAEGLVALHRAERSRSRNRFATLLDAPRAEILAALRKDEDM